MTGGVRALLRLFTYQGSWTFERLQGIGLAFCMAPLVRQLEQQRRQEALGRASAYFNTHPFLAGLVVGAVARAETDGAPARKIGRLRGALKGPLGSIGDRLVWSGVLPLAVAIGLITGSEWSAVAGVVACLGIFNVVHVGLRAWGLRQGWLLGTDVGKALHRPWLQGMADRLRPVAMLALGFAIPVYAFGALEGLGRGEQTAVMGVAVMTYIVSTWLAPTLGAARIGLLAVGAGVLVGLV